MKIQPTHLILIGIIALVIMGFSRNQSEDYYEIGDVKYSILPPNAFLKTQKGSWVLLDGKPIAEDQKLYTFLEQESLLDNLKDASGNTRLPDARGNFLRSMNINGQGNDVQAGRTVGSYQADAFKKHSHPLNLNGNDSDGGNCKSTLNGCGGGSSAANKVSGNTGGIETRPKNIALYCYIKVSN